MNVISRIVLCLASDSVTATIAVRMKALISFVRAVSVFTSTSGRTLHRKRFHAVEHNANRDVGDCTGRDCI